ncbi:MAG: helix-turn-helix domain-containing protein [Clostridia bacterium]|nr:helix-turn-helix domain-containing protein [Clostridia bacterium]
MNNYGEALKEQRIMAELSMVELAKQIGTSHGNISRWESGKVLPNIDFCVKLADFYGITVDELIGRQIK